MTQGDSIFGTEPDRVKRLLAVGAEAHDMGSEEQAFPTATIGALMEKPGTRVSR